MQKLILGLFGIILTISIVGTVFYYQTEEIVTITVMDKERIVESDGESTTSKYLIFTEAETFENTDLLFKGKFNSSDIQGQLQEGETYTVEVIGWRVPFASMYRNIVEIQE